MGKRYDQITYIERHKIEALLKAGLSFSQIANELERACSTISREVNSHKIIQFKGYREIEYYDADAAQRQANQASSRKGANLKLGKDYQTASILETLIKAGYSPYAALEIAKRKGLLHTDITVRTLYNYIYAHVLDLDESDLIYGRRKIKDEKEDFKKRRSANDPITHPSIEDRPLSVLRRSEFGHWEMDTVVGSTKSGNSVSFLTLVERKTRYLVSRIIKDRTQSSVHEAMDEIEKYLGQDTYKKLFKSITMDNGVEFLDIVSLKHSVYSGQRIDNIYYCHPYCSSERGSNEVIHRFLRRKWPKGTDLSIVDPDEFQDYIQWVNNYPRKIFDGDSSYEHFIEELSKIQ